MKSLRNPSLPQINQIEDPFASDESTICSGWLRSLTFTLVMKRFRSILLVALGIGLGLAAGFVIGSRRGSDPVRCTPALRNLEAAMAQWQSEAPSRTNGAPDTNSLPATK